MPDDKVTDAPWYAAFGVPDEDAGILGKYQDEAEAVKSIAARERFLSQSVSLPKANAKPEERAKQTRDILGRLGAFGSPDDYRRTILENLPDALKSKVTEQRINEIAERAHADGLLPDIFVRSIKEHVQAAEAEMAAEREAQNEALRRQKTDDEHLTVKFGRRKTEEMKDAESFCRHYDDVMFNLDQWPPDSPFALTDEQRREGGGPMFRLLTQTKNPYLYRLCADLQRRGFGEGQMPDHQRPPSLRVREQDILEGVKNDYAVLGEDRLNQYARQRAGTPG